MFGKTLLNVARRSRKFIEGFLERTAPVAKQGKPVNVARCRSSQQPDRSDSSLLQRLAQYGRQNLASQLRRQFSRSPLYREYKGLASKLSMYAFVGIGVASSNSGDHDFASVCEYIKDNFSAATLDVKEDPFQNLTTGALEDYQLGSMIAKGCSAAVYGAKYLPSDNPVNSQNSDDSEDVYRDASDIEIAEDLSDVDSDIEVITDEFPPEVFHVDNMSDDQVTEKFVLLEGEEESDVEVIDEQELTDRGTITLDVSYQHQALDGNELQQTSEKKGAGERPDLDLAIKIMFNYDIESNESELYKHLENELLPARIEHMDELLRVWHDGHRAKEKSSLPSHPNIVTMYGGFVDDFPALPEALEQYPCALPRRVNPDGCGRNKTLFLVMKRYPYTLREYMQTRPDLSLHQSTLLLLQLVEAVVHMTENGVAHRDLKSDNIFVEEVEGCPHLVVSDFGESIHVGKGQDLCIPYVTEETTKGGNYALCAPEIACARPGPNCVLDYRKSDLWAVGAIAYEIFGQSNPFYRSADGNRLRSTSYTEDELPVIYGLPAMLQKLLRNMLCRNPDERLTPREVSACLHLMLWSPTDWLMNLNLKPGELLKAMAVPSELDLIRWLLLLTAQVLLEKLLHENQVEHQMRVLFLSHLDFEELVRSTRFLCSTV